MDGRQGFGETFDAFDPRTGAVIAQVQQAGESDLDDAVVAGTRGLETLVSTALQASKHPAANSLCALAVNPTDQHQHPPYTPPLPASMAVSPCHRRAHVILTPLTPAQHTPARPHTPLTLDYVDASTLPPCLTHPSRRTQAKLSPMEKGKLLHKLADLVELHAAELGEIDALDLGMPLGDATGCANPLGVSTLR